MGWDPLNDLSYFVILRIDGENCPTHGCSASQSQKTRRPGGNFRNAFNLLQAWVSHILKLVKTLRIVLGILAIIPIYLIVDSVSRPAMYGEVTLSELAYLIFGTPISILNLWAWMEPEIIESYFVGIKNRSH